ncbi:MAG: hypothetical protein IT212_13430, partial [Bacteroidia bacterium]|nr:hypothetical protein [Bacteroidia bacterium]
MDAQISSLSIDNSNPTATELDQMWSEMSNTAIDAKTGVNNVVNFTSNNSNNPFNIAIRNSLINDRFVLGLIVSLDNNVTDRIWHIQNPTVTLRIEYLPPSQTVTLDQRLSNNTQVGKLRKWEGTYFTPYPYINPGTQFVFPINTTQTVQGDQIVYPNGILYEKYNNWNDNKMDVRNHHGFPINTQTNLLTSKFVETNSGIRIKNSLEGTTVEGGIIKFKDPWLIDYPDPNYGNTLRNQGMSAPFKNQTSPFIPDYTSSYNGDVYKGIFTNQQFNSGTYYSVGSPAEQLITVNGQSRKFYPFSWGGTGITLQNLVSPET